MQPRHQKNFIRKLSDQVQGAQLLASQDHQNAFNNWTKLQNTSEEIGRLQASIDRTLDKVRGKMLEKCHESEQLLEKCMLDLEVSKGKFDISDQSLQN